MALANLYFLLFAFRVIEAEVKCRQEEKGEPSTINRTYLSSVLETWLSFTCYLNRCSIEEETRRQAEKEGEPSIIYLHVLFITALMHRLVARDLANLLLLRSKQRPNERPNANTKRKVRHQLNRLVFGA